MGYCMNLNDVEFTIKNENKEKALQAIKDLAKVVEQKGSGGSWSGGKQTEFCYSWVDTNEFLNAKTLEEALGAWRWEADTEPNGDIECLNFNGEKLGDDVILFDAIAPYVEKGSYIEMMGEDNTVWRWVFDGEKMKEKTARFVYDD